MTAFTHVPAATARRRPLVAVAGNPNTGKTTLFNRLTGSDLKVSNYPGVTVESHTGSLALPSRTIIDLMDVPGAYSLSARSREEEIAICAIAGLAGLPTPDVVVLVVDATQLSRNLYLALQVIELALPVVIALNMIDMIAERGETIDAKQLAVELGVPVVEISALHGRGLTELAETLDRVVKTPASARPGPRWTPESEALRADVESVIETLPASWVQSSPSRARALALWALLSLDEHDEMTDVSPAVRVRVLDRRARAAESGRQIDAEVIGGRYAWIDAHIVRVVGQLSPSASSVPSATERVDRVLLHPAFGFVAFLAAMGLVFQSLFSWADPAIGWIEAGVSLLSQFVGDALPGGLVREFVCDGLIAGVGSVVVFLPQILLLFFFIGLMEDSGYMARVAFLMDRIMRSIGLHGRAFVPMLSGYACAVPAILATRTMERQRDRTLTMLVIPLMTCSARLPVYALLIGALFPPSNVFGFVPVQGLLMIAMYLFSTVMALAAAAVLSRTLFKGPRVPLILELPPYRRPHWASVLRMMWQRSQMFLKEAGGVILVCTIALWLLLSFPRHPENAHRLEAARTELVAHGTPADEIEDKLELLSRAQAGENLRSSYGGQMGHAIEPVIAPLGFDWKVGIGLIGAFAAREVFVSTMGVVYGVGDDAEAATLREKIRLESRTDGKPVYSPLMGLSLMVFFALACQCMSTLAAVYRETRSWRWPVFMFVYMTALAWLASFVVYQGGTWLGLG
jgi:ferrous iron transport protein B